MYIHFAKKVCISHASFLYVWHIFAYVCLNIKQYMPNIFKHILRYTSLIIFDIYSFYKNIMFVYISHVCLHI